MVFSEWMPPSFPSPCHFCKTQKQTFFPLWEEKELSGNDMKTSQTSCGIWGMNSSVRAWWTQINDDKAGWTQSSDTWRCSPRQARSPSSFSPSPSNAERKRQWLCITGQAKSYDFLWILQLQQLDLFMKTILIWCRFPLRQLQTKREYWITVNTARFILVLVMCKYKLHSIRHQ